MPANTLQRRLTEERRERAWTLYCQGLPCWAIGKELGISRQAVDQLIATVRKRHPAKEMSEEAKWLEAYDTLREVGLMMRQQIAKARADGEPVQALLATLSTHSDRLARFLTKQAPVAAVEVNTSFDTSLWSSLLGANAGQPMESAEVVEALPPTPSPQDAYTMAEKPDQHSTDRVL